MPIRVISWIDSVLGRRRSTKSHENFRKLMVFFFNRERPVNSPLTAPHLVLFVSELQFIEPLILSALGQ